MKITKYYGWLVALFTSSIISFLVGLFVLERVYAPYAAGHRSWLRIATICSIFLIIAAVLNLLRVRQPIRATLSGIMLGVALALVIISGGIGAPQ
jgi:uncharacterized membrane protein (UPF0136 family)